MLIPIIITVVICVIIWLMVYILGSKPPTAPVLVVSITPSGTSAHIHYNIKSRSSVTSVGVIWSQDQNFQTVAGQITDAVNSSGTFVHDITLEGLWSQGDYYARVFAENSVGTTTQDIHFVITVAPCLVEGTMITLADYTSKLIENIDYDDLLLVWNFDRGCLDTAHPFWIKKMEQGQGYTQINFSNGQHLRTYNHHRIFNLASQCFTYAGTDDTPIGTPVRTITGQTVVMEKSFHETTVKFYNLVTYRHMNVFANGLLTSCRFNNLYTIKNMKYQKEARPIRPFKLFTGVEKMFYDGFRMSEQTCPINEMISYAVDRMNNRLRHVIFLDHYGVMSMKKVFYQADGVHLPKFNRSAVNKLNKYLDLHPHTDLVVSSDWKKFIPLSDMQEFYRSQGIKPPIDYTPTLNTGGTYAEQRRDEIRVWLHQHPTTKWLAIDDLNLDLPPDNFLHVTTVW